MSLYELLMIIIEIIKIVVDILIHLLTDKREKNK